MSNFLSQLEAGVKHRYVRLVILFLSLTAIPVAGIIFIKTQHAYYQPAYVAALVLGALYIYSSVETMPFLYFIRITAWVIGISYLGGLLLNMLSAPGWWIGDIISSAYIAYESRAVKKKFMPIGKKV